MSEQPTTTLSDECGPHCGTKDGHTGHCMHCHQETRERLLSEDQ